MKNFTKKIFLLTVGMILSVGAYSQITHHWPEVRFTIVNEDGTPTDEVTYHIPGWDAWHRIPHKNSLYVLSHLRVQKYEKTGVDAVTGKDVFNARLVTRYIVSPDNVLTVPSLKDNTPIYVKFEEQDNLQENLGVKNIRGLQYKDIFKTTINSTTGHNVGPDGTNYDVDIIDENLDTDITISGTLSIPAQMTHAATGEIYNLDEIGDYALRQYARTTTYRKYNYVQASKIIIPKEITKIGRGAFFNNCHTTEIEFEEGSSIEEIPELNFQDNTQLQKITFPSSVKKLNGTVLGGCPNLNTVVFNYAGAPTIQAYGTDNIFESSTGASATKPNKCIIEVPLHSAKKYVDSNDKFKEFPMSSKFTMNKAYVTFCSDLPFTFKQYNTANTTWNDGDVKAYYVTFNGVKDGKVTLTEITEAKKIPSTTTLTRTGYFGVVLNGTAKETYDIFYPNNLISDELQVTENCMQGVVKATRMGGENPGDGTPYMAMDTDHYTYFVLTDGKFLTVTEPGNFGAHKAFLMIEGSPVLPAGARELTISLPDETTGITTHEVQGEQNDAWYTLQGIQVNQPGKGIFIKNGKKYIIK